MTIQLVNPTSYVAETKRQKEHKLDILEGKKVGYVFNQHGSALAFWKAFEKQVEKELNPSAASTKKAPGDPPPGARLNSLSWKPKRPQRQPQNFRECCLDIANNCDNFFILSCSRPFTQRIDYAFRKFTVDPARSKSDGLFRTGQSRPELSE